MGMYIFWGIIIAGVIIWGFFNDKGKREEKKQWFKKLGETFDLKEVHYETFFSYEPKLRGNIDDYPVSIYEVVESSYEDDSDTYTIIEFRGTSIAFQFSVKRENVFSKGARFFGKKDISVNDKQADDDYLFKSSNPEMLKALMTPEIVAGLKGRWPHAYAELKHQNRVLKLTVETELNSETGYATVKSLVYFMCELLKSSETLSDRLNYDY